MSKNSLYIKNKAEAEAFIAEFAYELYEAVLGQIANAGLPLDEKMTYKNHVRYVIDLFEAYHDYRHAGGESPATEPRMSPKGFRKIWRKMITESPLYNEDDDQRKDLFK